VRRYVRDLEEVMIALARAHGIAAGVPADKKKIGVWVDLDAPSAWSEGATHIAKIGAVGVRLSRWVTMHGFAFNVSTALSGFELIVPCGIAEHGVTSLAALGVDAPSVEAVARETLPLFARVFEGDVNPSEPGETLALVA
jgi:lipoyl(octanoyl) transferase